MYKEFRCPNARVQAEIDALPKMDPAAKKRWVDALLSGEYKQATSALRTSKGFCCLGVAADVFKADVQAEWDRSSILGEGGVLPSRIATKMGLNCANPDVYFGGARTSVAELNDQGVDFEMIAGLIINQL